MSIKNTGVYVLTLEDSLLDKIYSDGSLSLAEVLTYLKNVDSNVSRDWAIYPHTNLVLKSLNKKSALAKVSFDLESIILLEDYGKYPVYGLRPRNKEQNMLIDAIMDEDILCVVVEGKAGSGKTICTLAAALELLSRNDNDYERIILTRPMSAVGASMGAMPGDEREKFLPYLRNFFTNFEALLSRSGMRYIETMIEKKQIDIVPVQLIGGASWPNTIIVADEIQSLTHEQMYALGTRPSENSKLILMGDSAQRYGRLANVEDTGLWKLVNSHPLHKSNLTSYIKLIKQERSPLADVFYNTFVEEEG